jgi:hypothetical protein
MTLERLFNEKFASKIICQIISIPVLSCSVFLAIVLPRKNIRYFLFFQLTGGKNPHTNNPESLRTALGVVISISTYFPNIDSIGRPTHACGVSSPNM